jgi:hypothetical protein
MIQTQHNPNFTSVLQGVSNKRARYTAIETKDWQEETKICYHESRDGMSLCGRPIKTRAWQKQHALT